MGIVDKIKELENEYAGRKKQGHRGPPRHHQGQARGRGELLQDQAGSGGGGEGFAVPRSGDGRVALIGFPSVGKSSLVINPNHDQSEAAGRQFTTLTCIRQYYLQRHEDTANRPYRASSEGAAHGKGRGKEVIAVARTSDLVLIVLDAAKEGVDNHKMIPGEGSSRPSARASINGRRILH